MEFRKKKVMRDKRKNKKPSRTFHFRTSGKRKGLEWRNNRNKQEREIHGPKKPNNSYV